MVTANSYGLLACYVEVCIGFTHFVKPQRWIGEIKLKVTANIYGLLWLQPKSLKLMYLYALPGGGGEGARGGGRREAGDDSRGNCP